VAPALAGGNTQPNPVPTVTAVSPSTLTASGAQTAVTVTGTGFVSSSIVQWNKTNRQTSFVSATQLQAVVLSTDIGAAGTGQVDVINPAPGGGAGLLPVCTCR
jgi:hypothetical protein